MPPVNSPNPACLAGYALAVRAERIDADNWLDEFAAAPAHVAAALGLSTQHRGELAMVRSRIPFSHFNMVLTLGCPAAVDPAAFDEIERFYAEGGAGRHWILVNPHSRPQDLLQQLTTRGYEPAGAWERVVLQGVPEDRWATHADGCEIVTPVNAAAWSSFVVATYAMPPLIADWLRALVGRPGWTHAIRREGGAKAARS